MVATGSFEFRLKRANEEQIHMNKDEVRLKRDANKQQNKRTAHFYIRLKRTVE